MNNLLYRTILLFTIVILFLVVLHSCNNNPTAQPNQVIYSSSKEPAMTTVVYPSLQLSANGSTALLDKLQEGFQVYSVPELQLRLGEVSYTDLVKVVLSSSGTSLGVQTTADELILLSDTHRPKYPLPRKRKFIRSLAISDSGDKLAILSVDQPQSNSTNQDKGILEIWSLSGSDAKKERSRDRPLATIKLPLLDSSVVTANGTFSTFAVHSTSTLGNRQFMGVYRYDLAKGELLPLWEEQGVSLKRISVALFNDWVWAVQANEIAGWYQGNFAVEIPAKLREHLIYSPTGSHLLTFRGEETLNVTTQKMLFRLFDLVSLKEIKRATHIIQNYNNTSFALSKDLSLLELSVTRDLKIERKELEWSPL
jgi:hypothetical protein